MAHSHLQQYAFVSVQYKEWSTCSIQLPGSNTRGQLSWIRQFLIMITWPCARVISLTSCHSPAGPEHQAHGSSTWLFVLQNKQTGKKSHLLHETQIIASNSQYHFHLVPLSMAAIDFSVLWAWNLFASKDIVKKKKYKKKNLRATFNS